VLHPDITRMQVCALMEACEAVSRRGVKVKPHIMVPLVGCLSEFEHQKKIILDAAASIASPGSPPLPPPPIGTMIEVPRACMVAASLAAAADFFSFGTNDLTSATYGIRCGLGISSQDDALSRRPTPHAVDLCLCVCGCHGAAGMMWGSSCQHTASWRSTTWTRSTKSTSRASDNSYALLPHRHIAEDSVFRLPVAATPLVE